MPDSGSEEPDSFTASGSLGPYNEAIEDVEIHNWPLHREAVRPRCGVDDPSGLGLVLEEVVPEHADIGVDRGRNILGRPERPQPVGQYVDPNRMAATKQQHLQDLFRFDPTEIGGTEPVVFTLDLQGSQHQNLHRPFPSRSAWSPNQEQQS